MCNAHNHPVGCRCGFGGEGHKGRRTFGNSSFGAGFQPAHYADRYSPTSQVSGQVPKYLNPLHSDTRTHCSIESLKRSSTDWPPPEAKTIPISCRCCGARVFLHTNGNGDTVLLEGPLGPPWHKHDCQGIGLREYIPPPVRLGADVSRYFGRGILIPVSPSVLHRKNAATDVLPNSGEASGILVAKEDKAITLVVDRRRIDFWPIFMNEMQGIAIGALLTIEYSMIRGYRVAIFGSVSTYGAGGTIEEWPIPIRRLQQNRPLTPIESEIVRAMYRTGRTIDNLLQSVYAPPHTNSKRKWISDAITRQHS